MHEMAIIEKAMACQKAGKKMFETWALIMTCFRKR
jgi:hypothetical protein